MDQAKSLSAVTATLRPAVRSDIKAMHRVRLSVRENVLTSTITQADHIDAIEGSGRSWLIEVNGVVVAFASGNARNGNIWALFVEPEHERRGYGRRLHDTMVSWLFAQGVDALWLTTGKDTRAQRFYEAAGWRFQRVEPSGELRYALRNLGVAKETRPCRRTDDAV